MTKTIETPKRPLIREDVLYEHIADTYFYQKNRPKSRRKKDIPHVRNFVKPLIAPLVGVILLILLFYVGTFLYKGYLGYLRTKVIASPVIKVVDNGMINSYIIRRIEFRGYAQKSGRKTKKNVIILHNPKKYNWADISIDFKFPIDLTARYISLSLRGNVGGERVNIVLRDVNKKSARLSDLSLSSNWTDKTIPLNDLQRDINLSSVDHLRIECGYVGESGRDIDSPINFTVFIKNIGLLKERGI